jgi:hypothetical protein
MLLVGNLPQLATRSAGGAERCGFREVQHGGLRRRCLRLPSGLGFVAPAADAVGGAGITLAAEFGVLRTYPAVVSREAEAPGRGAGGYLRIVSRCGFISRHCSLPFGLSTLAAPTAGVARIWADGRPKPPTPARRPAAHNGCPPSCRGRAECDGTRRNTCGIFCEIVPGPRRKPRRHLVVTISVLLLAAACARLCAVPLPSPACARPIQGYRG